MYDYDWDQINEIANKLDIVDVIERYQEPAKQSGDRMLFHCCVNNDSTPSLTVNLSQNYYKCFSCGSGGNALSYLIKERKMHYKNAVGTILEMAGRDETTPIIVSDGVKFFKKMKGRVCSPQYSNPERVYKNYSEYIKYTKEAPEEWVQEGIDPKVMDLFDVRIDTDSNRIVYPLYDSNGKFIAAKGRTRFAQYKLLGIPKYMSYSKIGICDFFAGMEVTKPFITENKKIIITEGIKSVYKLFGWGYKYCAAAETSSINEYQIKLLISMGLEEAIIAFDADKEVKKIAENLNILKSFIKVSIVTNKYNLLQNKDSPVDRGREVFEELMSNRIIL